MDGWMDGWKPSLVIGPSTFGEPACVDFCRWTGSGGHVIRAAICHVVGVIDGADKKHDKRSVAYYSSALAREIFEQYGHTLSMCIYLLGI